LNSASLIHSPKKFAKAVIFRTLECSTIGVNDLNHSFDLVIFDCAGVLVDTEDMNRQALMGVFHRFGINLTEAEATSHFHGISNIGIMEKIQALRGLLLGDTFIPALEAEESNLVRHHVQAIEGVRRAVEDIVNLGLATCVASNGSLEALRERLGYAGLADLFADRLFSAEQVARGKPFPDVFLRAATTMGYPPSECVVIEDSKAGIQAGQAAGTRVLGFCPKGYVLNLQKFDVETFCRMDAFPGPLGLQKLH